MINSLPVILGITLIALIVGTLFGIARSLFGITQIPHSCGHSNQVTWSPTWPDKPGLYWFYGRKLTGDTTWRRMLVNVYITRNEKVVYITTCAYAMDHDKHEGVWTPAIIPPTPDQSVLQSIGGQSKKITDRSSWGSADG